MTLPEEHAEQYKMLRNEIIALVEETRKVESHSIIAIAALYAWLATHSESIPRGIWFLGFPLALLAGIRSLALFKRIGFIASYLRIIESKYFTSDIELPGYERYFALNSSSRISPTSVALWVVLLLTTIIVPMKIISHKPPKKDPAPIIKVIGQFETPAAKPSTNDSAE